MQRGFWWLARSTLLIHSLPVGGFVSGWLMAHLLASPPLFSDQKSTPEHCKYREDGYCYNSLDSWGSCQYWELAKVFKFCQVELQFDEHPPARHEAKWFYPEWEHYPRHYYISQQLSWSFQLDQEINTFAGVIFMNLTHCITDTISDVFDICFLEFSCVT